MTAGYSADQVRAAEAPLLTSGVPLMARAAAGLAAAIREVRPERVLLLVGSGDNGGDALFAGVELANDGIPVQILRTGDRVHEAGLARALESGAVEIETLPDRLDGVDGTVADDTVVVDGMLGIGAGAGTPLRGRSRAVVRAILALPQRPRVVAVDIPSGVNPDDGSVADAVQLPADLTVTFGAVKAGLLRGRGAELAGHIRLIEIGLDLTGVTPLIET
ncbi:NAD(P)H-hydrate epimerase [Lacisediminihabitans changchengi]|uniref:NAD(P)H-hydrate epimerase n=1 Tax=Lacisediminihabitans changchengi TaxID=2787634 RepID=A0A934VWS1_9MICO|nr:NAD(P)H-hydrate epimerase [Lacisediminihabitans changchengi]MBK4346112.1 NAD(P)H-hydrate epimerase [Lacisediminihabitans changchengi]